MEYSNFQAYNTMRPALHVVRFKYSNSFHASVKQIHRRTERDFPTVQINSTIPSSSRGIRQDKIILKCINYTDSGIDRKSKLSTTRGLPYGIRQ